MFFSSMIDFRAAVTKKDVGLDHVVTRKDDVVRRVEDAPPRPVASTKSTRIWTSRLFDKLVISWSARASRTALHR